MQEHIFHLVAGVVFGLANVIPGVSGGTMAVVFGVYERLIGLIANIRTRWKQELPFILTFGIGAGLGIVGFGKLMKWVLNNYPVAANAFFLGVVLGSLPMLVRETFLSGKKWTVSWKNIVPGVVALAIMIPMALAGDGGEAKAAAQANMEGNLALNMVKWLLGGVLAASCMIIPGVSGSFVMLLVGLYGTIIAAVADFNFLVLIPFAIGAVLGLLYCAKLIKWLLKKYARETYSAILGFVLGSILCIVLPYWREMLAWLPLLCCLAGVAAITVCNRFSPEK